MDKCRTLIEQAHLPKNLWGFAAMTAVHLINRLPTKVLHLKSLVDVLEEKFPKVRLRNGLRPRIFGCVSYVHSPHWSPDKLSTKALKCGFIGYSNTQKGYKCYHPLTRRVIISKDIVFDENRFYYQPNTESIRSKIVSIGNFQLHYLPLTYMKGRRFSHLKTCEGTQCPLTQNYLPKAMISYLPTQNTT